MNLDEVRYFMEIYQKRSISQAANSLTISPQGLSLSLKRFEAKLGVPLFSRTPQGVVPTEHATHLYPLFKDMLKAEDQAYRYLAELKRADRVQYIIGRDSMLGDTILQGVADYNKLRGAELVKATLFREPEDRIARIFMEGGYDYRFLSAEIDDLPDLSHVELCKIRFIPLVNRESEAAKRGSLQFCDLKDLTVLAEYRSFAWVGILDAACRKLGFELKLREVGLDHIGRLLSHPGNEVAYIREQDLCTMQWTSDDYCVPETFEPLEAHIVMQAVRSEIDQELVACLRKRLLSSHYAEA